MGGGKVNWFRRKRKSQVDVMSINGTDLMHRFLLDTRMPDAQQLSLILGLTPMEDPDEESYLSTERVKRAALLTPVITLFADNLAFSLVEFLRLHGDEHGQISDSEAHVLEALIATAATGATLGTITQLEDIGLINYVWSSK